MADSFKILGATLSNAVYTIIYTVPASKMTVGTLHITNMHTTAKTYRVNLCLTGEDENDLYTFLAYDDIVQPNSMKEISGIAMAATEKLLVYGEDANLAFNFWGDEMDVIT